MNFLGEEGPDRVRAASPGKTWERLSTIKQQNDPTNLFRLNQNFPPARGNREVPRSRGLRFRAPNTIFPALDGAIHSHKDEVKP